MKKYGFYSGGEFIISDSLLPVVNPYTGNIIANVSLAQPIYLEQAIQNGLLAQEAMAALPSYRKYAVLMEIANRLQAEEQYFAETICKESAKPIRLAKAEVQRSVQTLKVAAEESKRLPREYISLDWTPAGEGKEAIIKYFPIGLIAGISPFNFPLNLAIHKIAPAIASGNPIIVKPSSLTPITLLEFARILKETDLPENAVQIMPMDRVTGDRLVRDERIKMLSFTGSSDVGWEMKKNAGKKKILLELGGNAGAIVAKGCNIETAVAKCVSGGFSYSGQVCIHTQRIYVQQDIFNDFTQRFIEKVSRLREGDPMNENTEISVVINSENAIRIEQWVNEALDLGATILCGGKRHGNFYEPTVITNTQPQMKVYNCEVFGPVLILESYRTMEEAVLQINRGCYGLQAGIFSDSLADIKYAFAKIEAGGVVVNDTPTFRVDHMPYGGVKDSGIGREGISYAIREMMELKLLIL
ncbi:MAG: aldehyde dehydrogenase family protein [Lentimicrobiaceae bacterium]|nr:aldehyde dehydrogenase family protein [Lentimicrobiaceae bacterium]